MLKDQRGIVWMPVLIVVLFLAVGYAFFRINYAKPAKQSPTPEVSSTPLAQPTASPAASLKPALVVTAKPVVGSPTPKPGCDQNSNICFESNDLNLTIYEGNMEDNDKWITDKLYIIGQTEKGFEINWEGIPGPFTYYSPDKSFPNGKKETILVRVYKDQGKKGSYKGKISVKDLGNGATTTANLTLNYVDWNDSLIHVTPSEVSLNCTAIKLTAYPSDVNWSCNDDQTSIKLYYFGQHDGVEVKSIPDPGSKRSLGLKVENKDGNVFSINNSQIFWVSFEGFPSIYKVDTGLGLEPSGSYKGVFVFTQQSTQKELLRVPYSLNYTALKP